MSAHLSELQKMLCKISEASNVNQSRVEPYTGVSNLSDSKGHTQNITKGHKKLSQRRKHLKTSLTYNARAQNEKYITLSNKALSDDKVKLLSRGLKSIPTPPVPSSNKSFLQDFDNFVRTMRLKYMFADKKKTTPHPFHVRSSRQQPVQNSASLEKYLEETKLELDSVVSPPSKQQYLGERKKSYFLT